MNYISLTLLFSFITLNVYAQSNCTNNILQNSGFENGLTNWETNGGQISTIASTGSKSLRLCQGANIIQTLPTVSDKTFTLTFKARGEYENSNALCYIKYLTNAWEPIVTEFFNLPTSTIYLQGTVSKLSPSGTSYIEIGFLKETPGCVLIDDVCLSENGTNPCLVDNTPPVFTNCPTNINLTTSSTSAVATWTVPSVNDNCSNPSITSTANSGSNFPLGSTNVMYTATDAKGNKSNCIFNITVSQNGNGTSFCANPTSNVKDGNNSIIVSGITTNCAYISVYTSNWSSVFNNQVQGSSFTIPNIPPGNYIVKVKILGTGCTWPSTCENDVNVTVTSGNNPCNNDAIAPVFAVCPSNITSTTQIVTWIPPTATDNCGTPTISSTANSGSSFSIGTTPVIYTATDAKGNKTTCTFGVTVTAILNNNKPDLALSLTASPQNPGVWRPTVLTLTISNTGTVAASGVKVDFINQSKPQISNLLAYQTVYTPIGTSFDNWFGVWNIPTINPGQSLVLTYNAFTKTANSIPVFAQISTQSPADADSSPGNNTTGKPNEDDEVLVTLNTTNSLTNNSNSRLDKSIDWYNGNKDANMRIFPNPSGGIVNIYINHDYFKISETDISLNKNAKVWIYNIYGMEVLVNQIQDFKDVEQMDLMDLPSGIYYIKVDIANKKSLIEKLILLN
jgi:HYR domain/Secretion system C-terminal sorting domain/Domain of unknown function DUF11